MKFAIHLILALSLASPLLAADLNVPGQYATVQAAIDAAVRGDRILIAPGEYTEKNIQVTVAGLTFAAAPAALAGGAEVVFRWPTNASSPRRIFHLTADGRQGATFVGLTFVNTVLYSTQLIAAATADKLTCRDCTFINEYSDPYNQRAGTAIEGSGQVLLDACRFERVYTCLKYQGSGKVDVIGCSSFGSGSINVWSGYDSIPPDVTIRDNIFEACHTGSYVHGRRIEVCDNLFMDCTKVGLHIYSGAGYGSIYANQYNLDVRVTGNQFRNNKKGMIYDDFFISSVSNPVRRQPSRIFHCKNNFFGGNEVGLATGVPEHYQYGSGDWSVEGTLDYSGNWWGSATGPQNVSNPEGLGDKVITFAYYMYAPPVDDYIILNPWLVDPVIDAPTLGFSAEWELVSQHLIMGPGE